MNPEFRILQIAQAQGGVVRRDQALDAGYSARRIQRRVEAGIWAPVNRAGYRLLEVPGRIALARAAAAVLPRSTVSHFSAAAIHNIPLVPTDSVSVTVDASGTHEFPGVTVFRSLDLQPSQVVTLREMPVTSIPRTAVDLAACLSRPHLSVVVDEILAGQMCGMSELSATLTSVARRGRKGVANMRKVIDEHSDRLERGSPLEVDGYRLLFEAGFVDFKTEFAIPWDPTRRFDVAFPDRRVAIEWDSRRWHTQKLAFQTDRERDRQAHEHGWRILRFTWDDVHQTPDSVVDSLRSVLELDPANPSN